MSDDAHAIAMKEEDLKAEELFLKKAAEVGKAYKRVESNGLCAGGWPRE
jgi:hypothetical protein